MPIRVISKEFLNELGAEAVVKVIISMITMLREPAEREVKRATRRAARSKFETLKKTAEFRDELMAFILKLPKTSRDGLLAHLARHMTFDNRVVERLVSLYKHLGDKNEVDLRLATFKAMGRMSDEQFDNFVEHLTNDFIEQYARKVGEALLAFGRRLDQTAENLATALDERRERFRNSNLANPGHIPFIGWLIDPVGWLRNRRS